MAFHLTDVGVIHPARGGQSNATAVLSGVNLSARQGERIALIGASGAGKTTLLRVIGSALRPQQGGVSLLGQTVWSLPAPQLRQLRCRIGTIHQAPPLPPRQRVITAILAGRLGQWPLWKGLLSWITPIDLEGPAHVLQQLDMGDKLFARCEELSGGQLQRVGIARVLYQRPQLILADEPVSAMDPALAEHTLHLLLNEARQQHVTLVTSLHAVDLALALFDRIVGIKDGRIHFDRPPHAVTHDDLADLYASERGIIPHLDVPPPHAAYPSSATPLPPLCRPL